MSAPANPQLDLAERPDGGARSRPRQADLLGRLGRAAGMGLVALLLLLVPLFFVLGTGGVGRKEACPQALSFRDPLAHDLARSDRAERGAELRWLAAALRKAAGAEAKSP